MNKPRIFISAVSQEFKSARAKIEHTLEFLGYEVVQQDIWGTEPGDLRQMLRDKIDRCEALIHLPGLAYGAEPSAPDPDFGRVSYTQFEFLYAVSRGKKTYLILPTDDCPRDKDRDLLDLDPRLPAAEAAARRAEFQALQREYLARLQREGHIYWPAGRDPELNYAVLRVRNDSEELRAEYRQWQERIEAKLDQLTESQKITAARIRAHLQEASEQARARDLAEAEANARWEARERLRQGAEAAHAERLRRLDALAEEFVRLEKSQEATTVFKELTRVTAQEGVTAALAYLDHKRPSILAQHQAAQSAARDLLQPLLSGAQLAESQGDLTKADQLFRELLQADPAWNEARHRFWEFLIFTRGDRAVTHENLAAATAIYEEAEQQCRFLLLTDANHPKWQRDLSVSYNKLGELAVTCGKLDKAERLFADGLKVAQALAESDPGNAGWQRDLFVSYSKLGDLAVARGKLDEAERLFGDGLNVAKALTESDPDNTGGQRDLSVSYERLGDLAVARGKLDEAERLFGDGLKVRKALAKSDPGNAGWQRDLSVSYDRLGDLAVARGKLDEAERHFGCGLKIRKALAESDPGNAGWQRDLSVSYDKLGDLAVARGELDEAERLFGDSLKVRKVLAESDAGNAGWQRDLSVSYWKLAILAERRGDSTTAANHWRQSHDALNGLDERGLHISPKDREVLDFLKSKIAGS
jgi:tetratricopeptide (TPR) repeat protein